MPPVARWLLAALLVFGVAFAAHGEVRDAWLFDDATCVRNVMRQDAHALATWFSEPGREGVTEPSAYRPLSMGSIALLGGFGPGDVEPESPRTHLLFNLLFHILNGLLVWHLVAGWLSRRDLATLPTHPGRLISHSVLGGGAAALLFVAHPLATDALGRVLGRTDILATTFVLLTMLAWGAVRRGRIVWLPFVALLWFAALLCKEIVIGLPLVFILADQMLRGSSSRRSTWRQAPVVQALIFVPPTILYLLMGGFLPGELPGYHPISFGSSMLTGLEGWFSTALSWISPARIPTDSAELSAFRIGPEASGLGIGIAATLAVAALIVLAFGRSAANGFASWLRGFVLAILWGAALAWCAPSAWAHDPRYAYIAMFPFCVGAAWLIVAAMRHSRGVSWSSAMTCLLMVGLILLARKHHETYADDESFTDATLLERPAHLGMLVRAIRHHRVAAMDNQRIMADLPRPSARTPLNATLHPTEDGYLYQRLRIERARHLGLGGKLVRFIEGDSEAMEAPDLYREHGLLLLADSKHADALKVLRTATEQDSLLLAGADTVNRLRGGTRARRSAELLRAMAKSLVVTGKGADALAPYKFAVELDPSNAQGLFDAGAAVCKFGAFEEGLDLFDLAWQAAKAPKLRTMIQERMNALKSAARSRAQKELKLGLTAVDEGKDRDAASHFERAMMIDPRYPRAFVEAGWWQGYWFGNYTKAYQLLDKAESLLKVSASPGARDALLDITKRRKLLMEQKAQEDRDNVARDKKAKNDLDNGDDNK